MVRLFVTAGVYTNDFADGMLQHGDADTLQEKDSIQSSLDCPSRYPRIWLLSFSNSAPLCRRAAPRSLHCRSATEHAYKIRMLAFEKRIYWIDPGCSGRTLQLLQSYFI